MKRLLRTGWQREWQRRAPRERALAVLALLVCIGAALDTALLVPQRKELAAAKRESLSAREKVAELQAQVAEQSRDGDAQFAERRAALQSRRVRAEQVITDAQVDLIAPQDMREQLASILARFPQLKVVAVTSLAPASLGDAGAAASPAIAAGVYQHGIEVQVEGKYFELLTYLEALEKTPRRIYWRELELQVNPQGVPVTRIALFTLSKEPVWLRI
jgi:MSHA biogenesis protein MshJ